MLEQKQDSINVTCLAFAVDLVILSGDEQTAIVLKECAGKVGPQFSFTKTEFIATKHIETQKMVIKYDTINKANHFKYVDEIIEPTGTERLAQKSRQLKMRKAYGKIPNIYNKKCMNYTTRLSPNPKHSTPARL